LHRARDKDEDRESESDHEYKQAPVSGSKLVRWSEVAQKSKPGNLWIVIHDNVYDVSQWAEEHPGGLLLLLAFGGRDATEPFETMGHSVIAKREMKKLFVGRIDPDDTWAVEKKTVDPRMKLTGGPHTERRAVLTGGPASSSFCQLKAAEEVWDVNSHGFLPARDPVNIEALNGTPWEVFVEMTHLLPALGVTGALRRYLDSNLAIQARMIACGDDSAIQDLSQEQMERAFGMVGYTMVAYWRSGTLEFSTGVKGSATKLGSGGSCGATMEAPDQLPAFLSKPMLLLSGELERPPMIDYCSSVLYNWTRINPDGPITPSNIRCIHRLTGLLDEEWFFKTHVVIESEATHAVAAIVGMSFTDSEEELLDHLIALEEALWRVVRACLPIMYERSEDGTPKCSENIFYQILRPLIKSGELVFDGPGEPTQKKLTGPSGAMSTLLPCVDAALGIPVTSQRLRDTLMLFEKSMPKEHRHFLATLRAKQTIRDRIVGLSQAAPNTGHTEALKRAFNRCISRVLDFRWQHWQYVKNFIMKPGNISNAVGTGGTTFDFLQQHITDTEQARFHEESEDYGWPLAQAPELLPMRNLAVMPLPTQDFWSVDGRHGLLSREPLSGPGEAWAKHLRDDIRAALHVLWDLATKMPSLVTANGPFHQVCEAASEKLAAIQDDRKILQMSEVCREHLMSTLCHVASGCLANGAKKPPRCIDRPLQVVARSVGRPAKLEFSELVLCNWCWLSHGGSEPARLLPGRQHSGGNIPGADAVSGEDDRPVLTLQVWWRFLACPDEEWYRSIHIYMNQEARDIVAAIRVGQVAMREGNDVGVVACMENMSSWLDRFCDYFDNFFEEKDSRTESVMFKRLHPFIAGTGTRQTGIVGNDWDEVGCWVYACGSSVLLPALHAYLGIKMIDIGPTGSDEADRHANMYRQQLQEFRISMPMLHRAFLEELERPGTSLRQYCLRRFGQQSRTVEQLHNLEVAYNDALNALIRFLSRRVHLVCRLIPQIAGGFGAMHHEVEESMRRSRLMLLKMRQRVDRCLDTSEAWRPASAERPGAA